MPIKSPEQLHIPFLPSLKSLSGKELQEHIEQFGQTAFINNVNWPVEFPDNRKTHFFIAHDGTNIYITFVCEGMHLKAEVDTDLGPVANDSCVEFFVTPNPEEGRYWNFEFNCIGRTNASTRIKRPDPRRLSKDELKSIVTIPSAGTKPFDEIPGMHKWTLTTVIPLRLLNVNYSGHPVAMKANFYKCAGKSSSPHYLSWAPIETQKPDFHRPEFFGSIVLD